MKCVGVVCAKETSQFGWGSHPAAGDSKELWLGYSLGCRGHADLQSDETVTGEMSQWESFEAEDGLMGTAPHSRSFLNKSAVFLKPVGGEDRGSTHSGKYNTAVLCLCFSYNKKAIKCGMS